MIKKYPNRVKLSISDQHIDDVAKLRALKDSLRDGQKWWYCPRCFAAYDRTFKAGCYCHEVDGSYVPTACLPVTPEDFDPLEAALRIGGIAAVLDLVKERYG